MVFWIAVAVLAAIVTYVVTRPLTRGQASAKATSGREADLAVYKDQLAEIERDVQRGALSDAEAQSARTEVARRLLRAADAPSPASASAPATPSILSGMAPYAAVSILLPLASLGLYLMYGSPGMPGQPLNARLEAPAENAKMADLVAKVEEQLRAHPDDGKGWDVIVPVYVSQGRYADAANAFANAMRVLGETPVRLQRFADARIRAENGMVPEDARKALTRAVELEPGNKEPLIWLALAKEQAGDIAAAIADYKALLASAAAGTEWREPVTERLKMLEQRGSSAAAPGASAALPPKQTEPQQPPPQQSAAQEGPSGPAGDAVRSMAPADRAQFINQMVENLAARLKDNGNDLQGWLKLVRAYKVLGRDTDATAALVSARKSLASDANALAALDGLAKELGLGS